MYVVFSRRVDFGETQDLPSILQAVANAGEDAADLVSIESINNTLNTGICTRSEEEDADEDNGHVEDSHQDGTDVALLDKLKAAINLAHAEVSDAPEDKPEEAVEKRGHEGED